MVDVRDAVEGLYLSLTEPAALGEAFNIAAAHPTSHSEAAATIATTFNVDKIMVTMPMAHHLELNIDAARTRLYYHPQYDFSGTVHSALSGNDTGYIATGSLSGVGAISTYQHHNPL